ncbi:MAG TPA: His-Xaa-Ser system protein HxsD [Polyangiaceae bacterium]|jgi:His-Xaa-Ser system protein HxsD
MQGFPSDLLSVDLGASAVTLKVDPAIYSLDALYGAAYIFIDRCFVLLDKADGNYRVTLAWKKGEGTEDALRALVGEFVNELLSCAWRAKISEDSRVLIESVTAQALGGALGAPTLDDLEKFDFSDETFEDPLGIAMSWEDKHRKKARPDDPNPVDGAKVTETEGKP